jgi:hypothetical protein
MFARCRGIILGQNAQSEQCFEQSTTDMIARLYIGGLILLGLGLFCVAGRGYIDANRGGLTFQETDRQMDLVWTPTQFIISFPVHNPSNRSVQVVGSALC